MKLDGTKLNGILSRVMLAKMRKACPDIQEVRAYSIHYDGDKEGVVWAAKTTRHGIDFYTWNSFGANEDYEPEELVKPLEREISDTMNALFKKKADWSIKGADQFDGKWIFDYGYDGSPPTGNLKDICTHLLDGGHSRREAFDILSTGDLKEMIRLLKEERGRENPDFKGLFSKVAV